MSQNTKKTSAKIASLAADILNNKSSSQIAKTLAASALSQTKTSKQTGAKLEETAAKVLGSNKYSDQTKTLAASVLSQSNKER
jgi:hypothetical protein